MSRDSGPHRTHVGHSHSHSLSEIPAALSPFAKRFVVVTLTIAGIAVIVGMVPVSYTHLTLPTNREV